MKHMYWSRDKLSRLLIITCALCIYIGLEITNALEMLSKPPGSFSLFWLSFYFGLSSLVAFIFLAVGSLVWFYARERLVAHLLFAFSIMMMMIFIFAANLNRNLLFSALGSVSAIIALNLLSIITFYFPQNLFSSLNSQSARYKIYFASYLLFFSIFAITCSLTKLNPSHMDSQSPVIWLYYILGFCMIVGVSVGSYLKLESQQKKQQMRIFVYGVIISLLPSFSLTIVPSILNLPCSVDGLYTSLAFVMIPLALGYSVLRYQLLVLDTYIRRTVSFIVGSIALAILVYAEITSIEIFSHESISLFAVVFIAISMAISAPFIWWLARVVTDHLLFPEIFHYNRVIQKPSLGSEEILQVDDVAQSIIAAAIDTFGVPEVCLLVLDETSACYELKPTSSDSESDSPRIAMFATLQRMMASSFHKSTCWLDVCVSPLEQLKEARRPVLLSEIILSREERPRGLDRVMNAVPPLAQDDYLLAPLWSQGQMIGILVLGERADHQPYAGPDFEIAQIIAARFSPLLENARLSDRAGKHAALLNSVYVISTKPGSSFCRVEDVASTYAFAAACATSTFVEIWLYDEQEDILQRTAHVGTGPRLQLGERFSLTRESDWRSSFFSSQEALTDNPQGLPSCLSSLNNQPSFALAWLPLEKNQRRIGILVLTYQRPHRFVASETRVLELFASQCAATFEDVHVAVALRAAYERQKELDVLKEQFIMIASHELRTPLTAVQGYIELLCEHHDTLEPETQVEFLKKARIGCDELNLMVGNIMDANLIHVDLASMHLHPVSLNQAVLHVLEILNTSIECQEHSINTYVDNSLSVFADDLRLRQVLLNLISNAVKYSAPGTRVEISATQNDMDVCVSVRDYGLGVPPEKQRLLFERFMRLDRDLNSSVRGAGLGLYICEQSVNAMGGRIWVESSGVPGEGCTFTFVLRFVPIEQAQQVKVAELPI